MLCTLVSNQLLNGLYLVVVSNFTIIIHFVSFSLFIPTLCMLIQNSLSDEVA
jgi:hypothetical protein